MTAAGPARPFCSHMSGRGAAPLSGPRSSFLDIKHFAFCVPAKCGEHSMVSTSPFCLCTSFACPIPRSTTRAMLCAWPRTTDFAKSPTASSTWSMARSSAPATTSRISPNSFSSTPWSTPKRSIRSGAPQEAPGPAFGSIRDTPATDRKNRDSAGLSVFRDLFKRAT